MSQKTIKLFTRESSYIEVLDDAKAREAFQHHVELGDMDQVSDGNYLLTEQGMQKGKEVGLRKMQETVSQPS